MTAHRAVVAAIAAAAVLSFTASGEGQGRGGAAQPITVRAARVLDGLGGTLDGAVVEIEGSRIAAVDQRPVRLPTTSATRRSFPA